MRRILSATVILGLVVGVLLLALPAGANHVSDGGVDAPWNNDMNQETYWENLWGADCTKYENHSGFIPASYEAAVVKDGNMVRIYNPAPDDVTVLGAVNPANGQHFSAPHSWVMKCDIETTEGTTSTVTEESTTTLPEVTTTEPSTSSTIGTTTTIATSSTVPGQFTAWRASANCSDLVAEWGEGIAQVDVWYQDPQFGELGPADGITPFTSSGQMIPTGIAGEWVLVPVVESGWSAVPDDIRLFTEVCEETTTTISGSSIPELPFTGAQAEALAVCALALIGVGSLVVYSVKGREEI